MILKWGQNHPNRPKTPLKVVETHHTQIQTCLKYFSWIGKNFAFSSLGTYTDFHGIKLGKIFLIFFHLGNITIGFWLIFDQKLKVVHMTPGWLLGGGRGVLATRGPILTRNPAESLQARIRSATQNTSQKK